LNINRCRDHGCAPYIEYREWCGLSRPKRFSDLVEIDPVNQAKLASMYQDVSNIELFVGGSLEKQLSGSLVI
jgi:peroxidase